VWIHLKEYEIVWDTHRFFSVKCEYFFKVRQIAPNRKGYSPFYGHVWIRLERNMRSECRLRTSAFAVFSVLRRSHSRFLSATETLSFSRRDMSPAFRKRKLHSCSESLPRCCRGRTGPPRSLAFARWAGWPPARWDGGVAQWLGRRSSAGGCSLIYA